LTRAHSAYLSKAFFLHHDEVQVQIKISTIQSRRIGCEQSGRSDSAESSKERKQGGAIPRFFFFS